MFHFNEYYQIFSVKLQEQNVTKAESIKAAIGCSDWTRVKASFTQLMTRLTLWLIYYLLPAQL